MDSTMVSAVQYSDLFYIWKTKKTLELKVPCLVCSVTAVPSKKSSIQPGDRVLEINGVPYTEFQDAKMANELFEKLVLEIAPAEEEDDDEEEDEDSDDDLD